MVAIIALTIVCFAGFILRYRGKNNIISILLPSLIMPVLILIDEFILPYRGGGASMWPIALAFGSFYGFMASGFGVVLAQFIIKRKSQKSHDER
jgi:hypothetical protein